MTAGLPAEIRHWSFFHGTSNFHIERILRCGSARCFADIGAHACGAELWTRMKGRYGGTDGAVRRMEEHQCTFAMNAAMALSSIAGEYASTNYEYGDLFASLGLQRAARYAMRSGFGSELLGILADAITVLRIDGEEIEPLLARFAGVTLAIEQPSAPVVMEFGNLAPHQFTDGAGNPISEEWIASVRDLLPILGASNGGTNFDIRLQHFSRDQIIRVFRLDALSKDDKSTIELPGDAGAELEQRIRLTAHAV